MKINFSQHFKYYASHEIQETSMADALAQHLFTGTGLKPSGDPTADGKRKYDFYLLSVKLQNADEQTEYTPDELVMIKEVAGEAFVPGAYGQIISLIDGNPKA